MNRILTVKYSRQKMFSSGRNMTELWRKRTSESHDNTELHTKKRCSMAVDSHFLTSKSTKCMEIVSNPAIMDVSHTMDSYGPSSVLLAVIALL